MWHDLRKAYIRYCLKKLLDLCECDTKFVLKVRLASEDFGALIESRFSKQTAALDQQFISLFSSRKFPPTHPLGLSLAIHVARISRDESSLSQYLLDRSSLTVPKMMTNLLHAAGNLFPPL